MFLSVAIVVSLNDTVRDPYLYVHREWSTVLEIKTSAVAATNLISPLTGKGDVLASDRLPPRGLVGANVVNAA